MCSSGVSHVSPRLKVTSRSPPLTPNPITSMQFSSHHFHAVFAPRRFRSCPGEPRVQVYAVWQWKNGKITHHKPRKNYTCKLWYHVTTLWSIFERAPAWVAATFAACHRVFIRIPDNLYPISFVPRRVRWDFGVCQMMVFSNVSTLWYHYDESLVAIFLTGESVFDD